MNPDSPREKIFAIGFFILSVTVFSGIVNSLQSVFLQFFASELERREVMRNLTRWMKWRNLPWTMKQRLKNFVGHLLDAETNGKRRVQPHHVKQVLQRMSPGLRQETAHSAYA